VLPRADNADLARTIAGIRPAVLQFATPPCLGDTGTAHAAFLEWVKHHGQPLPKAWHLAWSQFIAEQTKAEGGMQNAETPAAPVSVSAPAPAPSSLLLAPRPLPAPSPLVAAARRLAALRAGAMASPKVEVRMQNAEATPPACLLPSSPAPLPPPLLHSAFPLLPSLTGEQLEQILCSALQLEANLTIVREYRHARSQGIPADTAIRQAFGAGAGCTDPHGGWDVHAGRFVVRPHQPDAMEIPWSAVAAVADRVVLPAQTKAEGGMKNAETPAPPPSSSLSASPLSASSAPAPSSELPAPSLPDGLRLLKQLSPFIPPEQRDVLRSLMAGEEGDWFITRLAELHAQISAMPVTYEQDGAGDDAIVHLHYFTGGADWFITERDKGDPDEAKPAGSPFARQHQAFGLADLFRDGGELGYISLEELGSVHAELDLHWTPKPLREVRAARATTHAD
jgi:hypothetical protein